MHSPEAWMLRLLLLLLAHLLVPLMQLYAPAKTSCHALCCWMMPGGPLATCKTCLRAWRAPCTVSLCLRYAKSSCPFDLPPKGSGTRFCFLGFEAYCEAPQTLDSWRVLCCSHVMESRFKIKLQVEPCLTVSVVCFALSTSTSKQAQATQLSSGFAQPIPVL